VTTEYRILPAGDTALVVEFGGGIDRAVSTRVLALAQRLDEARLDGIVETVPTFRSLMVCFDPLMISAAALAERIGDLMPPVEAAAAPGRVWRLPACYDARLAPDLDHIADRAGLSPRAVVERHSATAFHVYMLGFLPGQAYLGDVPAELAFARRPTPRPRKRGSTSSRRSFAMPSPPSTSITDPAGAPSCSATISTRLLTAGPSA